MAENLWERAKEALWDATAELELTANAAYPERTKYPDEMRRWIRDMEPVVEAHALLAEMDRVECVEGGAVNVIDEPGGVLFVVTEIAAPPENATPALLLLLPKVER